MHSVTLLWLCAATKFLLVHGPEGQEYWVSIDQITSMRAPISSDLARLPKGVRCIIVTADGKFVPATELCTDIYKAIMVSR